MTLRIDEEDLEEIIEIRHDLHRNPEISGKEYRTTEKIRDYVSKIKEIDIIDIPLKTGLVCRLKSNQNGKKIGIRCDIDALPQTEETNIEYKSRVEGVMHACGHDFHTATLLGVIKLLVKNQKKLCGDVIFLFQNSEETTKGAQEVINLGLFEKTGVETFFGFHNWPLIDSGKVILKKGALMSTKTNFTIEVIGHGGHGSMPHLNIDPIVCASNLVMSLQTVISRNINPLDSTLLSINSINGGSVDNLVVDSVKMSATIRSLNKESLQVAVKRTEDLVKQICGAYQCKYKIDYIDKIPLVYNSDEMYQLAKSVAREVVGEENITNVEPTMASEDFAFYMEKVPSYMYWFGSGESGVKKEPLHSRNFYASDKGMRSAIEVLANSVLKAQE